MIRLVLALAAAVIALVPRGTAAGTSSINTTLPAAGPYNPAPIRDNFGAASNDINALGSLNAGATAPSSPNLGRMWLDTSAVPYLLKTWSVAGSQWVTVAAYNQTTALWMPPVGGGVIPSITSAATTNLGSVPQAAVNITGNQSIASLGTVSEGVVKFLTFTGSAVLVYNPTYLILPGAANLTMAPGQMATAWSLGAGKWRVAVVGGNTIGPTTSTNNEFAVYSGTTGTLKDGLNVLIGHTGGLTATDTSATTPFVPEPSFVIDWRTRNLFQMTEATPHPGEQHSTLAILNSSYGSGNGPNNDDLALILGCNKINYLTTIVDGEQDCMWAYVTQGQKGDTAAYLGSSRRVDNPAVPNYGQTIFEATVSMIDPVTGTAHRETHPSIGYGITGFQDVTAVGTGGGGVCRLTVQNTNYFDIPTWGITVTGIQGAPECNGYWGGSVVNATQVDLMGSVKSGSYTAGTGAAGTPLFGLGGPNFGIDMRAQTGQNGTAIMVSRALAPFTGTWGTAFRVRFEDDAHVAFDMSANSGRFVVQDPTRPSMLNELYSATFLNGPLRWAGSTVDMPRDDPRTPGTDFPGGGALGFNFSAGSGEVDLWNLYTPAASTLSVYQKTAAAAQTLVLNLSLNGSTLATAFQVTGGGMVVGTPPGLYKGGGTLNISGPYYVNNAPGVTCGPGAPTAGFQVIGGIVVVC